MDAGRPPHLWSSAAQVRNGTRPQLPFRAQAELNLKLRNDFRLMARSPHVPRRIRDQTKPPHTILQRRCSDDGAEGIGGQLCGHCWASSREVWSLELGVLSRAA